MPEDQPIDATIVEEFADLFRGFPLAFGQTTLLGTDESGKVKASCRTIKELLTLESYKSHLMGECGLGVIPLLEGDVVTWGALDIDEPGMDLIALELQIKERGFPLFVFRSKSGGAHCYLFLTEPLPACEVISALRHMSRELGYGTCEIFPKQTRRISP